LNEDTLERFRGTAAGARVGHVQQSQRFLKSLESAQSVRLITPVRDPLSRNVSAFFENLDRFDVEETSKDVNLAIRTFIERYPHTLPIRWFEQQMAQPLGVDALKAEPGKPYLYPDTPFELLILRAEDPDEDKEEALREFLEYPTLRLSLANVSENKPYAELYSAFKREFRPPPEMVDMLFDAPYVQRFYSPEERHRMKDRWNRPGPR